MKWVKTLIKNFKILSRSKGSALMILFAPLLIVLIIGFSFAGKVENTLDVGIYLNGNNNNLSQRFVDNLNTTENHLTFFPNSESCINAIKESVVVTCIVFPKDFALADNKVNEVVFYVDESRMNLVYQLTSSVTINLDLESGEVSKELTQRMLLIMEETKNTMNTGISSTVSMKAKLMSVQGKSSELKGQVSGIDVTTQPVDLSDTTEGLDNVSRALDALQTSASSTLTKGYALVALVSANTSLSTSDLKSALDSLNSSLASSNVAELDLDNVIGSIDDVSEQVDAMKAKLSSIATVKTSLSSGMDKIDSDVKSLSADLDQLKSRQEALVSRINSFSFKSADSITNPITTKVESVTAKNNKLTYSFPYLLMLVVLFVGIMLSSTLVFMEKDSRAFFRNFTTPTKSSHFIIMTYLTSLIIILVQSAIILLAVYFGLQVPILTNIDITLIFLFLGISVFILLGMIIGNIFSTSEAITMSTIAIGSIMLFLSNLVLPLETLSPVIAKIASYNPYVIVSESIRRAMLLGVELKDLYYQLAVLGAYIIVLLILVISIKKVISSKIFDKMLRRKSKQIFMVPEDHYLKIPEKDILIKNVAELHEAFKNMSHADYAKFTKPSNIFTKWLKESLNERKLASRLDGITLEKAIGVLEKYLDRK
jgi:ABC-type multidrug transport system permease subunit